MKQSMANSQINVKNWLGLEQDLRYSNLFAKAFSDATEKGSIDFSKPVKLLLEHDRTRPIGKLMDITADDAGIEATFKIAGTIAGDDSLRFFNEV